jgi:hypothetical protein
MRTRGYVPVVPYFASWMLNVLPSSATLFIGHSFRHRYDISRPSSSVHSVKVALEYQIGSARGGGESRTPKDQPEQVNVPFWIEVECGTRAGEDAADGMSPFDSEFIFLLGWWVPDRNQHFVAGRRFAGSLSRRHRRFELRLELRMSDRDYS